MDRHGNLYGTTVYGGTAGYGNIYELAHVNGSWILYPLYSFTHQGDDGCYPRAGLTIGPDGTLFGATEGGGKSDAGTLFNLKPPAHVECAAALCPRTETILHSFAEEHDGSNPEGNVVFDSQGNLYGTTYFGGRYYSGTVYKATRSGGTWNVSAIYKFGTGHGEFPQAGVVPDSAGNLYGTTSEGGPYGNGTAFELSPSEGGWIENDLHYFGGDDGCFVSAGLVFDRAGNLYGGTWGRGSSCGTIFELSPQGGDWNFTTLYTFPGGAGPASTLAIDAAGNLYGGGGVGTYGQGNVFELSPSAGGWTYTDLYDFTGGNDGSGPSSSVAVTGPGGYLYGTTLYGGSDGYGVIYQIDLGAR